MTRLEKLRAGLRNRLGSRSAQRPHTIYLDIGSHTTKVGIEGKALFSQPTCFLRHQLTGSLLMAGEQARKMLGKLPQDVVPIFPVRNGQIIDTTAYSQFVKVILQPYISEGLLGFLDPLRIKTALLFPDHLTQRRVVERGLHKVSRWLTLSSMAEALWKNVQAERVFTDEGCVIDIGGMTTKIYLFAERQLSVGEVYEFGGDAWTSDVIQTLRQKYHVEVGWVTAEELKQTLLHFTGREQKHTVQGKDIVTSLPTTKVIEDADFKKGSQQLVQRLVESFEEVCQNASPELLSRILEHGIYLTGGGSQIPGFGPLLEQILKVPVVTAKRPQEDIVRGLMVKVV